MNEVVSGWTVLALLLVAACVDESADGDDDDIGDGDADTDGDADLGLLPCGARTDRDDAQVSIRDFAYDARGRVALERISSDYPADGVVDGVRLEIHEYGEHDTDRVTHDDGADCVPEYDRLYDHRGRPLGDLAEYSFDARGNPVTFTSEHEDCIYSYDDHDNLVLEDCTGEVQISDGGGGEWEPYHETVTWTWTYDAAGHETALDVARGETDAEHWRWTWNDAGQRIREESWQDGLTAGPEVVDWTYDERGRLSAEVRQNDSWRSETSYSYECWDEGGPDAAALSCTPLRESASGYVAVSLGPNHGCALRVDGTLTCWGPADAEPAEGTFSAIGSGLTWACGLRAAGGALECFGVTRHADEVTWTPPGGAFVALDAEWDVGCGIRKDGTLACWGTDVDGSTLPPAGTFGSVAVGRWTGCALDADGLATCWGRNTSGQADAPEDERFDQIAVGARHGCGVTMDGALRCWGDAPDTDDGVYTRVAVGGDVGEAGTTCALRDDGTIACWGWGELGAPAGRFTAIDQAENAACALREDQRIVCWGDNSNGHTTPP